MICLEQQMKFYGKIARAPDSDLLRQMLLVRGDVKPASFSFKARGAPKHCWHNCVFQHCLAASGNLENLRRDINSVGWRSSVQTYVDGLASAAWYYS